LKLNIRHETHYEYAGTVSHSVNQLCVIPRSTTTQQILNNTLRVDPAPEKIYSWKDSFGNSQAHFSIEESHGQCVIESISLVETTTTTPIALPVNTNLPQLKATLATDYSDDGLLASKCLLPTQHVRKLTGSQSIVTQLSKECRSVTAFAEQLMQWIFTEFEYDPNFSSVVTSGQKAWDAKRGVCQDFAHVALAVLREAGIPARYVSGYLETLPPPGEKKLQGSDASHAWFSVYSPGDGWFDFDPTNNKRPDQHYVTTAWGRDYADVAPLKGIVYGGGSQTVTVSVDVNRVDGALYIAAANNQL
jgi:transglutaminase-like putative cysteine protease